jgi:CheY-like chemotaxis protein
VLLNLLSNAVKYNRDGGRVVVSSAATDGHVRLAVRDTGLGIAPEMLARLYTPFERLGADRSAVEGTGLGLALSKRLVEAMDGALHVESTVGNGTTFTVELPVAVGQDESTPELDVQAITAATPTVHGSVLYIEDNVANLRLVERIMKQRPGLELLSAMQGRRGVELARSHRPRVIVLDRHLPDLDGAEVLAQLRDDPRTHDIPVVILSADATPGQVSRLLAQGAAAYLTKPLDVAEFLALLDRPFDGTVTPCATTS